MSNKSVSSISENMKKLEAVLSWFESENITIEEALQKYEEAQQLSKTLELQLKQSKNKIEVIKQKFNQ